MKIKITVVAIDEERGVKATRKGLVEVPKKVVKLYEVLGGDEDDVLRRVSDTVYSSAVREMQPGRTDLGRALTEASGGRIGGRGPGNQAPVAEEAPAPGAPARARGGDPLASMLGLDIIKNLTKRDRASAAHAAAATQPGQKRQPLSPGPIGFGGRR